MAVNQLLSNCIVFAETGYFNRIINNGINNNNYENYKLYFDYLTFLIIENGYDNILPNQIKKLEEIPKILEKVNLGRTNLIVTLVCIFIAIMISLCVFCSFLIILTNKSMSDGMEKVSKIRLERIEEIIKRIKLFNSNLKQFRERDYKSDKDDYNKDELKNVDGSVINQGDKVKNKEDSMNNNNNNLGFNMYTAYKIKIFFFIYFCYFCNNNNFCHINFIYHIKYG